MRMAVETTRLTGPTITRATDLERGLLIAAGLEYEPVVMLEPTETGLTVRKLTADENIDYTEPLRRGRVPGLRGGAGRVLRRA